MREAIFRTAAVLGAGVMGAQIACHLANAGLDVELLDLPGDDEADRDAPARQGLEKALGREPTPVFADHVADRIRVGNFEDHLERLGAVDWIVEAVVEKEDVKRDLFERVEAVASADAVISSNTSAIPLTDLARGRGASFRRRFLGTHFFNPPRYLELLELVPTDDTAPEVLERMRAFGRRRLGKGVVVAHDVPGFVGNRIGLYAFLRACEPFVRGDATIEAIDKITGRLSGRPKSATFRTADLAGLDVLLEVARNLASSLEGEEGEAFQPPDVLARLVEDGRLGDKADAGFYRKHEGRIQSIDSEDLTYAGPRDADLGNLDDVEDAGDLPARLRALLASDGKAGRLWREAALPTFAYAARCVGRICDSPVDVDRAMRWGYGWDLGPFEQWDAIGFERVRAAIDAAGHELPGWIGELATEEDPAFYRPPEEEAPQHVFLPSGTWAPAPVPDDEIDVEALAERPGRVVEEDDEHVLVDLGLDVLGMMWRTKAGTISRGVIRAANAALDRVEDGTWRGLVLIGRGDHFSMGAHLGEIATAAVKQQWSDIEAMVRAFQDLGERIHGSAAPVVVCVHGRTLGGGCELAMASRAPVAVGNSFVGLVEAGVGLIPAGGGTMRMAERAAARAATPDRSDVQPHLRQAFETVAKGEVAMSGLEALERGFLPPEAVVVMNRRRRAFVAREVVVARQRTEDLVPPRRRRIRVLGAPVRSAFEVAIDHLRRGRRVSDHEAHVARRLAWVITGGDLHAPADVPPQHLLDLERETFLSLLGTRGSQQKIAAILTRGKPRLAQAAAKGLAAVSAFVAGLTQKGDAR